MMLCMYDLSCSTSMRSHHYSAVANFVNSARSSQLALNQTLNSICDRPNIADLQSSLAEQLLPVLLCTFPRRKQSKHHNVQCRSLPLSTSVGDDVLVDKKLAVSRLHGSFNLC